MYITRQIVMCGITPLGKWHKMPKLLLNTAALVAPDPVKEETPDSRDYKSKKKHIANISVGLSYGTISSRE